MRVKPKGTLKVVESSSTALSVYYNYAEGLVTLDKDNNWVPCLAEDWRWIDERTIEFKLREGVWFQNGERFNAEAVRINWEEYREMENPENIPYEVIPDETMFEIIDEYTVRFMFPAPTGLAFLKLLDFCQIAPSFFSGHKFDEKNWGYFPEPGSWATGPFMLVEGSPRYLKPGERLVLEAYEGYWDRRYPKVEKVIFDNTLVGSRKEAVKQCREKEGAVDIVTYIRPLDTLKVAESPFAKVVKSKDVGFFGAWFNQRKRNSKWRDIRLRKAVNYAINRKELLRFGAKGNAYNLGGFIPAGAYGHNPNLTPYTYNSTRAKSLLVEADYPDVFGVKMITFEGLNLEAQIVSRMLERIGFKVTLDVLTYPEFMWKLYVPLLDKPAEEQDWDLALGHAF
jgi:peptide/nickel transport system substrate-binding protein